MPRPATDHVEQLLLHNRPEHLLVYVHVPFCQAKCYYCNFAVDIRKSQTLYENYVTELIAGIEQLTAILPDQTSIAGIDIGGGTPTMLDSEQLVRLLTALKPLTARSSGRALSIETTPFIAAEQPEKMQALHDNGIDRISVGLQSTNSETLASVNRAQQANLAERAMVNLQRSGFERLSVDLIFALPGQTEQMWLEDLKRVAAMGVDTITTYDCLYRGKGRALTKRTADKPNSETYGRLYDLAFDYLSSQGYHAHYGSVNFSRHIGESGTSSYFEGRLLDGLPYIGLGNYASSLMGNQWWFAPYSVNQWLAERSQGSLFPLGDGYVLPREEIMAKHILANLSFGLIDSRRFFKAFKVPLEEIFGEALDLAQARNWLYKAADNAHLYLLAPGAFKSMAAIRSLFYTPQAIDWLLLNK